VEIEETCYFSFLDAVFIHFETMDFYGEIRSGVAERNLIESALARPKHAAVYEQADIIRQAATLCFGLIKNHPWCGGNKRTATAITEEFLSRNDYELLTSLAEIIELSRAIESDRFRVDEIDDWLRQRTIKIR
jgi:death on curing protein